MQLVVIGLPQQFIKLSNDIDPMGQHGVMQSFICGCIFHDILLIFSIWFKIWEDILVSISKDTHFFFFFSFAERKFQYGWQDLLQALRNSPLEPEPAEIQSKASSLKYIPFEDSSILHVRKSKYIFLKFVYAYVCLSVYYLSTYQSIDLSLYPFICLSMPLQLIYTFCISLISPLRVHFQYSSCQSTSYFFHP